MTTTRSTLSFTQAVLMLFLMLGSQAPSALAQGNVFTYQGQLNAGGSPANGVFSMVFYLYNVESNGTALDNVGVANVTVTNGLFTTPVAFSPGGFDGNDRWLEISVEKVGDGSFTTLAPRQKITATPYAIMAGSASNLLGVVQNSSLPPSPNFSGTVTGNSFSGNGAGLTNLSLSALPSNVALLDHAQTFTSQNSFLGNVGIGVANPSAPLEISGANPFPQLAITAPSNAPYGAFLSMDASATSGGKDYFIFSSGNSAGEGTGKLIFLNYSDSVYPLVLTADGRAGVDTLNPAGQLALGDDLGGTAGSLVGNYNKQLVLGGNYNGGFNYSNSVKLLITDYDNDGSDIYPIYVEDENNLVDFFIRNRSLAISGNHPSTAYFGGNVGIDIQNPIAPLQVNGNVRLGSGGADYAASGTENLRMVRGSINGDGSIARGSGFTAVHNGPVGSGSYTITFSPAFSGVPSVTVSAVNVAARAGGSISASSVTVSTINFSTSAPVDDSFSFIAMGPP